MGNFLHSNGFRSFFRIRGAAQALALRRSSSTSARRLSSGGLECSAIDRSSWNAHSHVDLR
ncbi:uncharacterized protein [Physcomitrium patens]|uniref:uncharacterized protein n=1 Tax=Physcomitrium patens TaxID=3218 RepID=UPI003CCDF973